ncbi:autotransporter outer membrane beta-barrel domain-containing protein [Rhodobacteraceae bacterium RKSG542]|uniref:autotransporter family protein n=1 Tax=Pseudovibrio flavus TaxID=2529854 RepID=UPI0012BC715B|nr:autotransporter outer membrane beta-barrel domain-containing protein [Pseudovibrio flavus]MTI17308.1 autotransporter outer membrane beta-barrel domain-containing protein [Pseudovibrio flavus]
MQRIALKSLALSVVCGTPLWLAQNNEAQAYCAGIPTPFFIVNAQTTINGKTLTSEQRYCAGSQSEVDFFNSTFDSGGNVLVYAPFNTTNPDGFTSFLFANSTFTPAAAPAFTYAKRAGQLSGPIVVSFLNSTIGAGRTFSFQSIQDPDTQGSKLLFADSSGSMTLDTVTIQDPTSLIFGAYQVRTLIGQPTDVLFSGSTASGISRTAIAAQSKLTLDNGSSISTIGFDNFGTIAGTGLITTLNFNQFGGTIEPGNSIGTLSIVGKLNIRQPSTLVAEVDPLALQNADLVAVELETTGADKLTVQVETANSTATPADYPAGNDYTVLTASSIDSDAVTVQAGGTLPAAVSVSLVPSPTALNAVQLRFTDNSAVPTQLITKPQVTPSQNGQKLVSAITATNLQTPVNGTTGGSGGPTTPLVNATPLTTAVSRLTNNNLTGFQNVHAEPYASYITVGLHHMNVMSQTVLGRGTTARRALSNNLQEATENDRYFWANALGNYGQVHEGDRLAGYNQALADFVVGSDLISSPDGYAGLFAAIGYQGLTNHDFVSQSIDAANLFVGLYGAALLYDFSLSGLAGYYYADNSSSRTNQNIGQFTGTKATGDFSANGFYAGFEASRDMVVSPELILTPSALITYAGYWQDGVNETGGGDFGYSISSASEHSFKTGIGLDATIPLSAGERPVDALAFARYAYDWANSGDGTYDITVTSSRFGSFTQQGRNLGAHSIEGGIGLTGQITPKVDIAAGLTSAFYSHGNELGATGRIRYRW